MMVILFEITTSFYSVVALSQLPGMTLPLTAGLPEILNGIRDLVLCVALYPFVMLILSVDWDASLTEENPATGIMASPRPRSPEMVRAAVAALRCR